MPLFSLSLQQLARQFSPHGQLVDVLGFPELSLLYSPTERFTKPLKSALQTIYDQSAAHQRYLRHACVSPEISSLSLELKPVAQQLGWQVPFSLRLGYLGWQVPGYYQIWFPDLDLHVLRRTQEKAEAALQDEVLSQLQRHKRLNLRQLCLMPWDSQFDLQPLEIQLQADNYAERLQREKAMQARQSLIEQVGEVLRQVDLPQAHAVEAELERILPALMGPRPRSVLLVGPAGCGKTAIIWELVRQLARRPRSPFKAFWQSNGPRLVAGMTGFGMWQERCLQLSREAQEAQALVLLGNLFELAEVGQSMHQSQGLASFLAPSLTRGEFTALLECNPEQYRSLGQKYPQLLQAFDVFEISPSDAVQSRAIIQAVLKEAGDTKRLHFQPDFVPCLEALLQRYGGYAVQPGRSLYFLGRLLAQYDFEARLGPKEIYQAFQAQSGLPRFLVDPEAPWERDKVRAQLQAQVQGQPEALTQILEVLDILAARLNAPHKPIASMLLVGPTGVGKTQTSKALAEFFFGDARRLIRLDMSEFSDAGAVTRLIGGLGVGEEGLLTAKIREAPFSLLLLDEFEKAHPDCFDLFLQVLGEGRLSDGQGRLADFTQCVILMTSNLGARSFAQASPGFVQAGPRDALGHFRKALQEALRPEFFNRIDRIVPYGPLDPQSLHKLVARELTQLQSREGLKTRNLQLVIPDAVQAALAQWGYDPSYGARPLKRVIEQDLLMPLASAILPYAPEQALRAHVKILKPEEKPESGPLQGCRLGVDLEVGAQPRRNQTQFQIREALTDLRRESQKVQHNHLYYMLQNRIQRAEQQLKDASHQWRNSAPGQAAQAQLSQHKALQAQLNAYIQELYALEAQAWMSNDPVPLPDMQRWEALCFELYAQQFEPAHQIVLLLSSTSEEWLLRQSLIYADFAQRHGAKVLLWRVPAQQQKPLHPLNQADAVARLNLLSQSVDSLENPYLAVLLEARGPHILPRLQGEIGLHLIARERHKIHKLKDVHPLRVELLEQAFTQTSRDEHLGRFFPDDLKVKARRSVYLAQNEAEDAQLPGRIAFELQSWPTEVQRCIEASLLAAQREALDVV